jgi:large subunit ribosomal protein L18
MASYKKMSDRQKRHRRVRNKISGCAARPRLNVFRSNKHIYAQLIDDEAGVTVVAVNTMQPSVAAEVKGKNCVEQADFVGRKVAELAKTKSVEEVVFDRGGFAYAGRVKALADGARAGGLKF